MSHRLYVILLTLLNSTVSLYFLQIQSSFGKVTSSSQYHQASNSYNDHNNYNIEISPKTPNQLSSGYNNHASVAQKVLVLVDGFAHYISGHVKDYCKTRNIKLIEIVSPYIVNYFRKVENREVPPFLRAPEEGQELQWWESTRETILSSQSAEGLADPSLPLDVVVLSESDSGVSTAERVSVQIGCKKNNGIAPQLRNKFQMNENARSAGLHAVQQVLAASWQEARDFILTSLWAPSESGEEKENICILKPYRGVASDGVYCCRTIEEAEKAFHALIGQSKYEGGVNEAVLVQEYSDGVEYAVDTVAMDGQIKVVALWRYKKFAANGAPFVYQCSELVSSQGRQEAEVCQYCLDVLRAQNLQWGPTHTEIKYSSKFGPTLIEINARWHAQNTHPITTECLGADAVSAALDAYFDPESFLALPDRPDKLRRHGMIVHLVSFVEGVVREVRHLDLIHSLPSFLLLDMPLDAGDSVCRTVNIRTDSGYVLLCHDSDAQLQSDFQYITRLQESMFALEPQEPPSRAEEPQEKTEQTRGHEQIHEELEKRTEDEEKESQEKVQLIGNEERPKSEEIDGEGRIEGTEAGNSQVVDRPSPSASTVEVDYLSELEPAFPYPPVQPVVEGLPGEWEDDGVSFNRRVEYSETEQFGLEIGSQRFESVRARLGSFLVSPLARRSGLTLVRAAAKVLLLYLLGAAVALALPLFARGFIRKS